MSADIHVDDVGTEFIATVKDENGDIVNLTGASSMSITFEKPDGSTTEKTATVYTDGTDGKMVYAAETGLLNQAGSWKLQGVVTISDSTWHTNITKFKVLGNL